MKNFKTAHDLEACFNTFCKTYNIDAFRCADKLFNFARSFEKFDCSLYACQQDDDNDYGEVSGYSDNEQSDSDAKNAKRLLKKKILYFSDALLLLCNPNYS